MNANEMVNTFKFLFDKKDTNGKRNFLIPEIDLFLNLATTKFITSKSFPYKAIGFERNNRRIEDLAPLVMLSDIDVVNNVAHLPTDYMFPVKMKAFTVCDFESIRLDVYFNEHDDNFESSVFDKSSINWRFVNVTRDNEGFRFHGKFDISKLQLTWIKKHPYIHSANLFNNGTYELLNGDVLTGSQDCILPEHSQLEIIDLAILIASESIRDPDLNEKRIIVNSNNN